ncbi:ScyD/ScyE family protein [Paeniglutamicibacter sp. ABSL32-1]|uniref:ScyD/ScyE family protein n=1 Tax=Paeniglutamicibacter quisquiliarum TaxID=2849498 RepID=UPI001C2CE387|nr:ScyD/ScyE family protein [Paeniglutamicibacter quisquiliarum]MBV1780103.1 ScyD/ScyE family protein [Paeniglutamicibacter quisquiliarum]
MKFRALAAVAAASAMTVTLSVAPAHATKDRQPAPSITNVKTLAQGFGGPLKVAFGPEGSILVAEAFAGKVTSVSPTGAKTTLVNAPGKEIVGVSHARGTTYYFENAGATGEEPPSGATPALLKSIDKKGKTRTIADLLEFEKTHDPDARTVYGVRDASASCLAQAPEMRSMGELYSHPFSSLPARNGVYVGDAGANTILNVNNQGKVSLVKVLPAEPVAITEAVREAAGEMGITVPDCMLGLTYWAQPVPTDITVKGNWMYYTVLPGVPGESLSRGKVYKMNLLTKKTQTVATGLSAPTGIALDKRGNVYVAELFGGGVAKIVNGHGVTVLPAMMASDVEIRNNKLIASTEALTPSGKLVTATLK